MYLELFRLKELPFRLSPDPQFLYLSKHHARAKAYMESTIWFTDGFVVITGDIGSGKTTLIETFLRDLDRDVVVAQINQTQLTPGGFLQSVLAQFGFSPFKMGKAELLATLTNFLVEQYAAGRKVVLVVDEAQNLSHRVLEEVRLLSGVETTKDKALRIILAGQPELNEKLNSPELVQLMQRVRLRFHLTPLTKEDIGPYVEHRLQIAGSEGRQIFSDAALALLPRYTGGVPRLINTLCDTAMMSAYAIDKDTVDDTEVLAAIEELQWVEYAARTNRMARVDMLTAPQRAATADTVLARLLVATKGRSVAELDLRQGRYVIGRTAENDLQIDSKYVSRHHCHLNVTLDSTVIEDLNSTNGIYVRGKRVRRHLMDDGDVVTIGQHELIYVDERVLRSFPTGELAPPSVAAGSERAGAAPAESAPEATPAPAAESALTGEHAQPPAPVVKGVAGRRN
jgi:general secretion pathway protein A